jgi:Ca-activated chloride channel family protein
VGGQIRAREIATGREVWRRSYAAAQGAQAITPPAVVGSQLVFGTVDGHLYSVDVDTGMTLWAYDVGEAIVFQPIVAQGWVYAATARGNLIGLEVADPSFDGWHMWGGNAAHAGLTADAGRADPALVRSLARPGEGVMRLARFEGPAPAGSTATAAPARGAHAAAPAARTTPSAPASAEPSETESEGSREEVRSETPRGPDETPAELPLSHTRVAATVSGAVATVTLTQEFRNPYDRAIEATYLFPLPADAAVDDMEMHIGPRVVRAEIQRQAEARRTYTQARAQGRRAALLEQQRPNLFAQRVANIAPGERIDVQLRYVARVPYEDGQYEFVFPMVAPRRYDPSHPDPTRPAADPLAPAPGGGPRAVDAAPPGERSGREVELALDLDAAMPIAALASPTHQITTTRPSDTRAHVALAAGDRIPNRDFVLRYRTAGDAPQAAVLSHRAPEGGYFSLVLQPPDAPPASALTPRDLTVLIDTSSSMNGRPLAHARAVAHALLASLRAGDTLQLVGFADTVHALAPTRLAASADSAARAERFLADLRATGATEMVPALRAALAATPDADRARLPMVVLVTDGFIGNEADVLRALGEGLGQRRVYAVGVGTAVNRFLLERASELGRGRAVVVTPAEDPLEVATRFARELDRPVFTDVEVDYGGLDVSEVYPRRIPDLFANRPLVLSGRYGNPGRAVVRVRGTLGGRRYERAIEVELQGASPDARNEGQRVLWARAAVHERLNALTLRDDPTLVEQVTRLGLAYRMVTPWTSFVAVDRDPPAAPPSAPQAGARQATPAAPGAPANAAPARAPGSTNANTNANSSTNTSDAEPEPETTATLSPARVLPGDPEVRISAPRDARAVTVVLPFGETVPAQWEDDLGLWTARFLIPRDADEGNHAVQVLVTHADGHLERRTTGYTVDSAPPRMVVSVEGEARPGAYVTLRARQELTREDLAQAGLVPGSPRLSPAVAQLLADTRRVEVRTPSGEVVALQLAGPGEWAARWRVPADASGTLSLRVVAVDVAANVAEQTVPLAVLAP